VSCKDGYTNSYVIRIRYVVLINVIMNWWVCNVMFSYLLVLYSNVYGKIVAYVVIVASRWFSILLYLNLFALQLCIRLCRSCMNKYMEFRHNIFETLIVKTFQWQNTYCH